MSLLFYVAAFLLGLAVATQVNRGIYRFAYDARLISPWSPRHPDASERTWRDRLPVIGWWFLRRDADVHGRRFWLRPALLELCLAIGFVGLLHFIVVERGLVPLRARASVTDAICYVWLGWYLFLICQMVMATFIDFDERTIPDEITVPGTLIGLLLAATVPGYRLPEVIHEKGLWVVQPIHPGSPNELPDWISTTESLWIVLACFAVWCFALLPILWTTRGGVKNYFKFAWASLWRPPRKRSSELRIRERAAHPWTYIVCGMAVFGLIGITIAWLLSGSYSRNWLSLVHALVGLAFGGGIVWWIRIIGFLTLGREAMGFGDVTLMAMIGTFVGWQAALMIFMFAPFAAMLVVVLQLLLTGENEIAFGPYLCISALVVMLCWSAVWNDWAAMGVFGMLDVLMPVLLAGFLLAAPLLWMLNLIKTKVLGYTND
jgi:prepilin signal peptidase PulO-like enzyme (type II secretory pathway)